MVIGIVRPAARRLDRGASLLELAITLPLIALLLMGLLEMVTLLDSTAIAGAVAVETARAGSADRDLAPVESSLTLAATQVPGQDCGSLGIESDLVSHCRLQKRAQWLLELYEPSALAAKLIDEEGVRRVDTAMYPQLPESRVPEEARDLIPAAKDVVAVEVQFTSKGLFGMFNHAVAVDHISPYLYESAQATPAPGDPPPPVGGGASESEEYWDYVYGDGAVGGTSYEDQQADIPTGAGMPSMRQAQEWESMGFGGSGEGSGLWIPNAPPSAGEGSGAGSGFGFEK